MKDETYQGVAGSGGQLPKVAACSTTTECDANDPGAPVPPSKSFEFNGLSWVSNVPCKAAIDAFSSNAKLRFLTAKVLLANSK